MSHRKHYKHSILVDLRADREQNPRGVRYELLTKHDVTGRGRTVINFMEGGGGRYEMVGKYGLRTGCREEKFGCRNEKKWCGEEKVYNGATVGMRFYSYKRREGDRNS